MRGREWEVENRGREWEVENERERMRGREWEVENENRKERKINRGEGNWFQIAGKRIS